MRTFDLLADELRGAADDDVEAVELADAGVRRRAGRARRASARAPGRPRRRAPRAQLLERALGRARRSGRGGRPPRPTRKNRFFVSLLDLGEPRGRRARPAVRGDLGVHLDLERLARASRRRARAAGARPRPRPSPPRRRCRRRRRSGTCLRQDLARAVGDVLARHLDEAERRDLDDVGLRPVALELGAQRLLDRGAVLRVRHVDEVDDDDPADVAQPQLAHDLLDRLEVVLRDRVLEPRARRLRARADEAAGVDVDDRERLGVVEDEVAARGQVDAAVERRADLRRRRP